MVATCYDVETGARVFTEEDIEALARKNAGVIERLFNVAAVLSGISEQDETDILGK